jgi:hypothetical protein
MKVSIGFSIVDWQKLSILFKELHQAIYGMSLEEKWVLVNYRVIAFDCSV